MEVDMSKPNDILEQVFDGGSADWYMLNDELGNEEATRILKDADALAWMDDKYGTAVTIRYNYFGNNATLIRLIESEDFGKSRWEITKRMREATQGKRAVFYWLHNDYIKSNEGVLLYD